MAVFCWGELAKSANDPTTIAEYIQSRIVEHNISPQAHGLDNYAIFNHRTDDELDHSDYSVVAPKIRDENVYNRKIKYIARAYKAIVAIDGSGDYDDIQDAIDYVNSIGGGNIFIKEGTYELSTVITLYSNIRLYGEDKETTIIEAQNTTAQIKATGTAGTPLRNIEIKGLNFQYFDKYNDGGILFEYCNWCEISGCEFYHNYNTSSSMRRTIKLTECENVLVERNVATSDKIFIEISGSDNIVQKNSINLGLGYAVYGTGERGIIKENDIDGGLSYGIVQNGTDYNAIIKDNHLVLTGANGIIVKGDYTIVRGNYIDMQDTGQAGVRMDDAVDGVQVIENQIYGAIYDGISSTHAISGCRVDGNVIDGGAGNGVSVSSNGSVKSRVCNNVISNMGKNGISTGTSNDGLIITGNVISDCGNSTSYHGIYIYYGSNIIIANNHIINSGGYGVYVNRADYVNVEGNRISGSYYYGVRIYYSTSDKCIVTGNNLVGNGYSGVSDSGTNTIIANNQS